MLNGFAKHVQYMAVKFRRGKVIHTYSLTASELVCGKAMRGVVATEGVANCPDCIIGIGTARKRARRAADRLSRAKTRK